MIRRPPRSTLFPYTDALPIFLVEAAHPAAEHLRLTWMARGHDAGGGLGVAEQQGLAPHHVVLGRSEEHTSELQSRQYLVCRLLLEKKNQVQAGERDRRSRDSL